MRTVLVMLAAAWLAACASATKQADAVLARRPSIPAQAQVAEVPFVQQSAGYCGPATLTMALNWAGDPSSLEKVAPQVYTPGMKGSLQIDMISAARRHGMMAVPIQGLENLLHEIAAGHPVIVLENLALSWYPQWHYAIVYGYDLPAETVTMHSGPQKAKVWDIRKFERSWELADYWGLVVLPAGELSRTASEAVQTDAAVGLEQAGQKNAAEKSYKSLLERWPQNLPALVGLGNLAYENKEYKKSAGYLKQATRAHPESASARHNLAVAEKAARELNARAEDRSPKFP